MTVEEFIQQADPNQMRTIAVLQFALIMGVIFFTGAILFLYGQREPTEVVEESLNFATLLSGVVGVVTLGNFPIAFVFGKKLFTAQRLKDIFTSENPTKLFLNAFRQVRILQMALMEGAALLGLGVCFINMTNGVLHEHPLYWLAATPVALFLAIALATFPTSYHLGRSFCNWRDTWQQHGSG